MLRLLMFGTFNPVTMAHIKIAEVARNCSHADSVIFIPTSSKYIKDKKGIDFMPDEDRVRLLQGIEVAFPFTVECCEIDGDVDGKTYHTLEFLHAKYPDDDFILCFGADKVEAFDNWYCADKLLSENKFIIVSCGATGLGDVSHRSKLVQKNIKNFSSCRNLEYSSVRSGTVRDLYAQNKFDMVKQIVPNVTYKYLLERKRANYAIDQEIHLSRMVSEMMSRVEVGVPEGLNPKVTELYRLATLGLMGVDFDAEFLHLLDKMYKDAESSSVEDVAAIQRVINIYMTKFRSQYRLIETD